jgi:DNA (cytosine-5)-methyltransferase 1
VAAYYNEIEPFAAQWLRNLIAAGHIAPGDVDERSIADVSPDDLRPYTQCHFFAGIGVWSHALRLAGWPDDRPVWTGSCPCQPFSAAGARKGTDDERHLWPEFYRLIAERHPPVVFGEQVASKDGLGWLDTVYVDMEASGYAIGAADMCAAGVGAPHIRQRLWFVAERMADANDTGLEGRSEPERERAAERAAGTGSVVGGLADAEGSGHGEHQRDAGTVAGAGTRDEGQEPESWRPAQATWDRRENVQPRPTNGHWRDADWLFCRDGKWRPIEPGTFPLAHGAAARVGRLRAYGNAIVPQVAQAFIEAYLET